MIQVDPHVHSVLTAHAASTVNENAKYARRKGIKGIVNTDHGPTTVGAAPDFTLPIVKVWPKKMCGVEVFHGVEANIMDLNGGVDVREQYLACLDFVLAGFHEFEKGSAGIKELTESCEAIYDNKYIDCISHPDGAAFPINFESVVKRAKKYNKLVELNNKSFVIRKGGTVGAVELMKQCMKQDVRIIVSSDAHICYNVGNVTYAEKLLKELNFPKELIVNRKIKEFKGYLQERQKRLEN